MSKRNEVTLDTPEKIAQYILELGYLVAYDPVLADWMVNGERAGRAGDYTAYDRMTAELVAVGVNTSLIERALERCCVSQNDTVFLETMRRFASEINYTDLVYLCRHIDWCDSLGIFANETHYVQRYPAQQMKSQVPMFANKDEVKAISQPYDIRLN